MLQRLIGMIWTSSGCAVWTSPRANSRTDRALRLIELSDKTGIIASGRRRFERPQPPHALADLERPVENRADRDEPEQLVPRHGREARRRDAPALRAVRCAPVLAGR